MRQHFYCWLIPPFRLDRAAWGEPWTPADAFAAGYAAGLAMMTGLIAGLKLIARG